jgi:hypothetical protein
VLNPPRYLSIKNYHKKKEASSLIRRKTLYIKIKDENLSIKNTRQMRAQVDTTQEKMKANNQQKNKEKKTLCK